MKHLRCNVCAKSVSSSVHEHFVVRGWITCPECITSSTKPQVSFFDALTEIESHYGFLEVVARSFRCSTHEEGLRELSQLVKRASGLCVYCWYDSVGEYVNADEYEQFFDLLRVMTDDPDFTRALKSRVKDIINETINEIE